MICGPYVFIVLVVLVLGRQEQPCEDEDENIEDGDDWLRRAAGHRTNRNMAT